MKLDTAVALGEWLGGFVGNAAKGFALGIGFWLAYFIVIWLAYFSHSWITQ